MSKARDTFERIQKKKKNHKRRRSNATRWNMSTIQIGKCELWRWLKRIYDETLINGRAHSFTDKSKTHFRAPSDSGVIAELIKLSICSSHTLSLTHGAMVSLILSNSTKLILFAPKQQFSILRCQDVTIVQSPVLYITTFTRDALSHSLLLWPSFYLMKLNDSIFIVC